ncbi:calmodulin-binding transcription activator 4-like [Telopea speciosissima]|uniref:calmodulin-binding transcription activator 4-like n=1 Tax=Telopea speciosissima TaxID=54955 RepID=UPI001CC5F743|nr:calmodulin-binding transcription activator 4-like [Telopea speciosissima]
MQSGFEINALVQEAQNRWLKPAEVLFILQNHEDHQITQDAPQQPPGGSLFLFNKRVLRFFRRDGHTWRKKKDGRTVGEAHERLKVGNVEALNCYYAHGEQNPNFQRRSYWILDPAYEHIVLVHYREVSEGRHNAGSGSYLSPGLPSTPSQSTSPYSAQNPGSFSGTSELYEPSRSSISRGSVEVSSESVIRSTELDPLDIMERSGEFSSSSEPEVNHALRRLQEQLSLGDDDFAEELSSYCTQKEKSKDSGFLDSEVKGSKQDEFEVLLHGSEYKKHNLNYSGNAAGLENSNNHLLPQNAGDREPLGPEYTHEKENSPSWKEMLELCSPSTGSDSREKLFNRLDGKTLQEKPLSPERGTILGNPVRQQEIRSSQWLDFGGNNSENRANYCTTSESDLSLQMQLSAAREFLLGSDNSLVSATLRTLPQVVENSKRSSYSSGTTVHKANPNSYTLWFDQENHLEVPLDGDSSLTIAQKQRFTICEISPEWGYDTEATKVIITGSFLCDPSEFAWKCMFGETEVPIEIIQEGVLRCKAPPHGPGKVSLCITCGNRESCSEIREFEYCIKQRSCTHCDLPLTEVTKSTEELLLLVRFAQMLLYDPLAQREDSVESGIDVLRKMKVDEDPWGHIIEKLLVCSETPLRTMDWLVQELLKDKLQRWLLSKYQEESDTPGCSLAKKEQGIIHMVAGLGFEWALNPILNSGISINFRDVNGLTALHWAARFGREKMVAMLLAAGASAGAVTDPTPQDPTGQTPASIAAANGHKGLAGYLSEVALTSHLSSLKLEETELSKGAAALEAEITVQSILNESLDATEDQLSLRDSLAAVRNAAQAAARIQSSFRAHSFRKRQQREAGTAAASVDGYDITADNIHEISAASKLAFRSLRDHKLDTAALSIQKKYRGWKGRKDFLALRRKVVKIQAHVRGHQVRKKYKVIIWAVGVLDKVVLRWRRRGVGLRGFRPESESIEDSEDEDILKVFRKQKVDAAINEAVARVLSMVESPKARQQYRRMLESYRQAKAELIGETSEASSVPQYDVDDMENDYMYQFPQEF